MWKKLLRRLPTAFLLITYLLYSASCAIDISPKDNIPDPSEVDFPTNLEPLKLVPTVFYVETISSFSSETELAIDILDDISGLSHNVSRYSLTKIDENHYSGTIMLPVGGEIKYRYVSLTPLEQFEARSDGKEVSFRSALIGENSVFSDLISGWKELTYSGELGTLSGIVVSEGSDEPLADVQISVAGYQTLTDASGRFYLEGLPVGVHNLVAVSINGAYRSFQQSVNIVASLSTSALIKMDELPEVTITFIVTGPDDAIGAPLRLIGNFYQTGNTFTEIAEGSSILASRAPLLVHSDDGTYSTQLTLHAGNDFRYKYSLGDGFLNAERNAEGSLFIRRFIVPKNDVTIRDTITTWSATEVEPVSIKVSVPDTTPFEDGVSIQFKQDEWFPPIPMWPLGSNQWLFLLFDTGVSDKPFEYQICRNAQCDIAFDEKSHAKPVSVRFKESAGSQYNVEEWHFWQPPEQPLKLTDLPDPTLSDRLFGFEFSTKYHPSQLNRSLDVLNELKEEGMNWLILTPSWRVKQIDSIPHLLSNQQESMLVEDMKWIVQRAKENGYKIALYPQLVFDEGVVNWWSNSKKSELWWQQWYVEYERFVSSFLDFAISMEIDQYIIGGSKIASSLPGALVTEGDNFGTPKNAEDIWTKLIKNLNGRYHGTLLWAFPWEGELVTEFVFFADIDGFYIEAQHIPTDENSLSVETLSQWLTSLANTSVVNNGKPVYFGLNTPSLSSNSETCRPGNCVISSYTTKYGMKDVNLENQSSSYEMFMQSLLRFDWVNGISTRGFSPAVKLTDFSSSIYGKPAMEVFVNAALTH